MHPSISLQSSFDWQNMPCSIETAKWIYVFSTNAFVVPLAKMLLHTSSAFASNEKGDKLVEGMAQSLLLV